MEPISLKNFQFNSVCAQQYSAEFISHRGALKIAENENEVHIAVTDSSNKELVRYLEGFHIPKKVKFSVISKAELASFVAETTPMETPAVQTAHEKNTSIALDSITEGAPVVNIINAICIEAIALDSSDIHIEAQADSVYIRYRIDGILRNVKKIDKSVFMTISNRIKIMANLNPLEQRLPQDGRMSVSIDHKTTDFRVSIIPITNGESIVLRIFSKSAKLLSLDELGFYPADLERIKTTIKQPYGLILLTGPTGSGKTTTLHALIAELPVKELKVITLEDPVEQIIPAVNQVQINDDINLSFDSLLRRVLRQDPNVIMVGEIRDSITAELALRSALTGHLILSTVHTNDSISVITRLTDMKIEPYLIAAVLRCSVAQRLVRKICPVCKERKAPAKTLKALMARYRVAGDSVYEARGCASCNYTGYRGRTIVSEVFTVDKTLEDMISRQKPAGEILEYCGRSGMTSLAHNALQKAADGITTIQEIEREVLL